MALSLCFGIAPFMLHREM